MVCWCLIYGLLVPNIWFAGADPLQETHCLQRFEKEKKALRALRALKGRGLNQAPPFGALQKRGLGQKAGCATQRHTRPPRARAG